MALSRLQDSREWQFVQCYFDQVEARKDGEADGALVEICHALMNTSEFIYME